ncbi:MAG: hypothetical protein ABSD13_03850 [Candidatus Korobacteraceae bacterium]|jgi:hypothetical protein
MARMVDLIRDGSAPPSVMRRAAQGVLSLPAGEAIEILVVLAGHHELGTEAEQTLVNWNEGSLIEVASDPHTPPDVLRYMLKLHGQRPAVVEALCDNPALELEELKAAASHAGDEVLRAMLRSERVRGASWLLELIRANPAAAPAIQRLEQWLATAQNKEAETAATNFLMQHAEEVAWQDPQPFELASGMEGEDDPLEKLLRRARRGDTERDDTEAAEPEEIEQLSLLQKIGRMRVGERIKLAMRGSREERMVLIRDRSKLVALAVLESPKVNDAEMETFAAMKNIQESVLRAISTKRNYIKNYGVLRSLASNPKTPLDVVLPLLAHLLAKDQRALAMNKNVNETVRKMALKMFRTKTEKRD